MAPAGTAAAAELCKPVSLQPLSFHPTPPSTYVAREAELRSRSFEKVRFTRVPESTQQQSSMYDQYVCRKAASIGTVQSDCDGYRTGAIR